MICLDPKLKGAPETPEHQVLKILLLFSITGHQSHSFLSSGLWAVVNNAGILGLPADGELIPMTGYKKCMAVNFFGAVEVTKAFLPLLRKSKGRLVNISSMAGELAFSTRLCDAWCARRGSLHSLWAKQEDRTRSCRAGSRLVKLYVYR